MALIDYGPQLRALLGAWVDTQLDARQTRLICQLVYRLDATDPLPSLVEAVHDIVTAMHRYDCWRVNPVVRPTSRWLDINCLLA